MAEKGYDLLVVGTGLFGATVAYEASRRGRKVLALDRRDHVGGNCWSFPCEGIDVHAYGPHVVHTDDPAVWRWFEGLTGFTPCMMSPIANYRGELYNLPFNMNTFHALWGVNTPREAREAIEAQRVPCDDPGNLEEHVLDMVGRDIYEKLVKGYTEKQYGKPCSQLPASLIARMPLLFTFDNDYSHVRYQGVPTAGWPAVFEALLEGVDVRLGVDYLEGGNRRELDGIADATVFTGPIDEYFGYRCGALEYRGRRFVHHVYEEGNRQGTSLMNYTDAETPELRTIEHKHFTGAPSPATVVTSEYATPWSVGDEPYYTLNDGANQARYARYRALAQALPGVHFGGRLGEYRYYDMQDTVKSAWRALESWFGIRVAR